MFASNINSDHQTPTVSSRTKGPFTVVACNFGPASMRSYHQSGMSSFDEWKADKDYRLSLKEDYDDKRRSRKKAIKGR